MSLSISIRHVNRIVVLELGGRLSVHERTLLHLAAELMERGERKFLISLARLSYLDNSGLGQLCLIHTALQNRGGDIKLLKVPARFKELLKVTRLDTVFQSFEREADAIAAMELCRPPLSQ
jgi:anti-anti-sigma factor